MSTQERLGFFVAMGGQVVEDDNCAGLDLGYQHVTDVGDKGWAVHGSADDPGGNQTGWPQSGDRGLGAP